MPSLDALGDSSALLNRYLDKVIVYVEGEGDQRLFGRIVGPDVADRLEFQTPVTDGGGCRTVIKRVQDERPANDKIFGLVDGETAVELGGVQDLVSCRKHLFTLGTAGSAAGVIFLAGHELENLILIHGGVCELVSKNMKLAHLGDVEAAEVEQTLLRLTRRFLISALFKYAAFSLGIRGAPVVTNKSGKLIDAACKVSQWLEELKLAVIDAGGNWAAYRAEAKAILQSLIRHLAAEAATPAVRSTHFIRLADGKSLLKGLQKHYGQSIGEGILADALTKPPYASEFRLELMQLTGSA